MPDRGHCLHPCWPCFQKPRLVLAGAPACLRSWTGPSLHLPRTADSAQRENNKRRPCLTPGAPQGVEGQPSIPTARQGPAAPGSVQRRQRCWDRAEGTGKAMQVLPPRASSLPVLLYGQGRVHIPAGPGSPRPGPPGPPPPAPPRSCSTAPPAWAVHRGRSARAAPSPKPARSPRRSPGPAALPASPRRRPPPPGAGGRGRRRPLGPRCRPHPGRELPPPCSRHSREGRNARGGFRPPHRDCFLGRPGAQGGWKSSPEPP